MPSWAISATRRSVSENSELPPSIKRSPWASSGLISAMTSSTARPALTMIMIARGDWSAPTNSSTLFDPTICPSPPCSSMNLSVFSVVRLWTAMGNPLCATFRARFCPMTASPVSPKFGLSAI